MLIKSVEPPRLIIGAAALGLAGLLGALVGVASRPAAVPGPTQVVAVPVVIRTPVVMPVEVPVAVQVPAAPEPEAKPALQARCIGPVGNADGCDANDGFPAISADGKTVVAKEFPEDGGRGNPGLNLQFIDVATSKVTTVKILDPNEYDETGKHVKLVAKRVAAVQKKLTHYRSLVALDEQSSPRADRTQTSITVTDGTRQIFQHAYPDVEAPHADDDNGDQCAGARTVSVDAWLDRETRTLVTGVTQSYGGPCWCGGGEAFFAYVLND